MSKPGVYSFGVDPITCHSWNHDRTQLAISPNNNEVHIYQMNLGKWNKVHVLNEHTQNVTGIDWAPHSNCIVTCGTDRNAYVWTFKDGRWKPTLVILRINRAATHVKWSPKEDKFAVASSARLISVCYFEQENNWWVSKHIKKPLRSTVTSIDWHPNNILIASGSSDFKARVFSGYIKEIEQKPEPTPWGKKMNFANCMVEFSNSGGGWVHNVTFSPNGDKLAWVGHDSSISVVNAAQDMIMTTVKTEHLPFVSCIWTTENNLVVAGHSCVPMMFRDKDNKLSFICKLDENKEAGDQKISAMKHFQTLDKKGTSQEGNSTTLNSTHQNTISQLCIHSGQKSAVSKFSSSGVDGQLVIWDIKSLEASIAALRIA